MKVGQFVEWDSSGGTARGKITQIIQDGAVPDIDATVNGTEEEPAARIQVYKEDSDGNYEASDTYVGHKLTELRSIKSLAEGEMLSDKQQMLVNTYITTVEYTGMFDKGVGANGAHYIPADKNVFAAEGIACKNCVFFAEDSNACAIVSGDIEDNAACKLWVIEEYELGLTDQVDTEESPDMPLRMEESSYSAEKYSGINFSPPSGVKSAAKRGLDLHEKGLSGGGLEPATVAWARKYVSGDSVSPERARMGNRFFGRNARFANAPKDSPAWVSWLLWGGGAGKTWFASLVRQMDNADKAKSSASTTVNGYLRLAEDYAHPLHKVVEMILTDFEVNANKEAIPQSETPNIIRTAKYSPIKIAASKASYGGHDGAIPIGPIIDVYEGTHEDKPVIMAKALIWSDEFSDIYSLLKSEAGEREYIGTSWELYHQGSEEVDGVMWLKNVTFAGTCIVNSPAYGERTKLLKVAENKKMEELQKELELIRASLAEKEAELDELRKQNETFKEAEEQRKQAEKRQNVINRLSRAGFSEAEIQEKIEFYLSLNEETLDVIVKDFAKIKRTESSQKEDVAIPEPRDADAPLDPAALARELKKIIRK